MRAFISGHRDLTMREFIDHYEQKIKDAIKAGHSFVVGDAPGTDWLAQGLLYSYLQPEEFKRVTVYHKGSAGRYIVSHFLSRGGYKTQESKDEAMTAASDYDIAWVRPGKYYSGTEFNILRRNKNGAR